MNNDNYISIKEYLNNKGIEYRESNGELITKCLFSGCDEDSTGNESHLYFSADTGQYDCKKCGSTGNIVTLCKYLGDNIMEIQTNIQKPQKRAKKLKLDDLEQCHSNIPDNIRRYLNERGLNDNIIDEYKLGYGNFYGRNCITIPITNEEGEYKFIKLRKDPFDNSEGCRFSVYPTSQSSFIYGFDSCRENEIFICEGEFDRLVLKSNDIPAITSTAGVGTFKDEWFSYLTNVRKIYLCFDKDDAGEKGILKMKDKIEKNLPNVSIYKINFPDRMTDGKDITDYFTRYNGNVKELKEELVEYIGGKKPIDISQFEPIKNTDLLDILNITIKKDNENKLITFFALLSAFTEDSQFNIIFSAPSSTGKSYIPSEISKLFPKEDLIEISYASPTAFFHDTGVFDKEVNGYHVDLARKILIFIDQPHTGLIEKLRPLLSHDQKVLQMKITDKKQKQGIKTKNVFIKGFPAVIFCSANTKIDEQEGTRFVILSPEMNVEKIRESVSEKIRKDSDPDKYRSDLKKEDKRELLIQRIEAIRDEKINDIKLESTDLVVLKFIENNSQPKPRHSRDVSRVIKIAKAFALLNVWFREKDDQGILIANNEDIQQALDIWESISESQEYGISPYVYNIYKDIIVPLWSASKGSLLTESKEFNDLLEKNKDVIEKMKFDTSTTTEYEPIYNGGIHAKDIAKEYYNINGRILSESKLNKSILPSLEYAGLINRETDPDDKRKKIITMPESYDEIINEEI